MNDFKHNILDEFVNGLIERFQLEEVIDTGYFREYSGYGGRVTLLYHYNAPPKSIMISRGQYDYDLDWFFRLVVDGFRYKTSAENVLHSENQAVMKLWEKIFIPERNQSV